jgi:hypothetical protein
VSASRAFSSVVFEGSIEGFGRSSDNLDQWRLQGEIRQLALAERCGSIPGNREHFANRLL